MKQTFLITLCALALLTGCKVERQVNPALDGAVPATILWAWERPEDLRFLADKPYGVAFLAQTIHLKKDSVSPARRRQPLEVAPTTYMIAVTRIETEKAYGLRPVFDNNMIGETTDLIRATLELPNVKGVQVDFDAVSSERSFYRQLMTALRTKLPAEIPLTMTSLASWCTGDAWFNDFPVDEAVPMVFQMGADSEKIKTYLRNGNDWREPLCRGSYGLALEEGRFDGMKAGRRVYYFKNSAWTSKDLDLLR